MEPLITNTALLHSLKPPPMTSCCPRPRFSSAIWHHLLERKSVRFALFCGLLMYLLHCFGTGVLGDSYFQGGRQSTAFPLTAFDGERFVIDQRRHPPCCILAVEMGP